jgi:hypothetical protein
MAATERKRPFYLVVALLGALAFGTTGALGGWSAFLRYHGSFDPSLAGQGIANEADRVAVVARSRTYLQTLDAAKSRGWPLGVAAILLGSAMFVFAMRGIGGSGGARAVLVQLVVVQAGANAASYWLMRDVFEADLRVREAEEAADIREHIPEWSHPEDRARAAASILRAAYPYYFALQTLGSALIVVALTRRRVREFFDATGEAVGEP